MTRALPEPSYTSCSVVFSVLFIVAGVVHAYSMNAAGTMTARVNAHPDTLAPMHATAVVAPATAGSELPLYASNEERDTATEPATETMPAPVFAATEIVAPPVPAQPAGDSWFINIASLASRDTADRYIARARELGIDATHKHVVVNGRPFWRVAVRGFSTPEAAKSRATQIKDRLELQQVWIGRETG